MTRRIKVLLGALVVALAVVTAACGGEPSSSSSPDASASEETTAAEEQSQATATAPGTEAASGECPFPDGRITAFVTQDLSGVSGAEVGPTGALATEVWVNEINESGGILGCEFVVDVQDDAFDIDACLRLYREALLSDKYDFYFGPPNSGCMASLPDLTNAAGKPLITGLAADHRPFFAEFTPYVFHASVSTLLEGRTLARFVADQGWERVALLVPNYAYGQDLAKSFEDYYAQIAPGGQIVETQFPELTEEDFTPYINAMISKNPDATVSAFFGTFAIPFITQLVAVGNDATPSIGGLLVLATFREIKAERELPKNLIGYSRGDWQLMTESAVGQEFFDRYVEAYGDEHPLPSEFAYQMLSSIQMAKALIEASGSLEAEDWKATVEAGDFSFESPYNVEPTHVNPINHMADACASVGMVIWNSDLPIPASYDPGSLAVTCMRDILPLDEARALTDNPDVTDEAIQTYESLVGQSSS
jgi:branched-chain amino acid transport system substrate-binding protein